MGRSSDFVVIRSRRAPMSRLPLTPDQAELSDRIYHALRQAAEADLRQLADLLASKPDRATPRGRPSSRSGTPSTRSAPRPSRPPWRSGKKGVPRLRDELPALPRVGPVRRVSAQDGPEPGGDLPPGAGLLPLPVLRHGGGPLGRGPRPVAAGADARGPRGGLHRRRGGQLRRGRRRGAQEAGRPAGLGIDRRADQRGGRPRHRPAAGRRARPSGRRHALALAQGRRGEDLRLRLARPDRAWGCRAPTAPRPRAGWRRWG